MKNLKTSSQGLFQNMRRAVLNKSLGCAMKAKAADRLSTLRLVNAAIKDREIALHGFESGRIVRLPGGEYIEVHEQLDDYERWKLVSYEEYQPLMVRPDDRGRITVRQRVRAGLSRWFFEDRIAPVTVRELEQQKH